MKSWITTSESFPNIRNDIAKCFSLLHLDYRFIAHFMAVVAISLDSGLLKGLVKLDPDSPTFAYIYMFILKDVLAKLFEHGIDVPGMESPQDRNAALGLVNEHFEDVGKALPKAHKKAVSNYFIDKADSDSVEPQDDLGLNFNEPA
jgi:hypothetical protein